MAEYQQKRMTLYLMEQRIRGMHSAFAIGKPSAIRAIRGVSRRIGRLLAAASRAPSTPILERARIE